MNTNFLKLIASAALLLNASAPIFADNNSNDNTVEQRIEKSAKELAAESIELATQEVKKAKQKSNDVKNYIDKRLDDTIINGKKIHKASQHSQYELIELQRFNEEKEIIEKTFEFVEKLGQGTLIFVSAIIILIIIGSYINRRQKYKIIEKAIENNYPLPQEFISKNVRPASTTVQHIHYTQAQASNGNTPAGSKKIVKEFNVTDWASFKSGIIWCAWGLSFMIFFLMYRAPIWIFAIIPIMNGLGKLFTAYQIQKAAKNAKEYTTVENSETSTPPPFEK